MLYNLDTCPIPDFSFYVFHLPSFSVTLASLPSLTHGSHAVTAGPCGAASTQDVLLRYPPGLLPDHVFTQKLPSWEGKMVQPLWKIIWPFLKKLKIKLSYDPANPLLDIYPKSLKAGTQDIYLYTQVHSSIIHTSGKVVQPNVHQHLDG